jgi:transposase
MRLVRAGPKVVSPLVPRACHRSGSGDPKAPKTVASCPLAAEHARESRSAWVSCQPLSPRRCRRDVLFTHGAGLDVHQQTVRAGRITPDPPGHQAEGLVELKACGPMTVAVLARSAWRLEAGLTHVALERTGAYWKPVLKLLDGNVPVVLVHAAHVQQVPGRQTDHAEARWVAQLMRDGWWPASFIPAAGQRERRELTRYRTTLVPERSRAVNRVPGVWARAHLKLAAVAREMMGVSGRAILAVLLEGRTAPTTMAALANGRVRRKSPLLEQALTGLVREHQRRRLALQVAPLDVLDEQSEALRADITRCLPDLRASHAAPTGRAAAGAGRPEADPPPPALPLTCTPAITRLETMPGVDQRGAARGGAETGLARTRVGTPARLAVWAGVAPGHDASAGQQRSGRTRPGHQPRRTVRTPLAHAAARTKGTSLSALSHRLAARRGKTRAMVAVAQSMVVSAFHRLSRQEPYPDLGAHDVDQPRQHHLVDRLTRRIERRGYRVH